MWGFATPPTFGGKVFTPKQAFILTHIGEIPLVFGGATFCAGDPFLSSNLPRSHPWYFDNVERVRDGSGYVAILTHTLGYPMTERVGYVDTVIYWVPLGCFGKTITGMWLLPNLPPNRYVRMP